MASDEGMLTDGQWKKLEVATLKNADNLSSSPKSHPLFADLNIKSPTGGKGPVAGFPFRHVRRTHSGKHIRVKKGLNFMKTFLLLDSWLTYVAMMIYICRGCWW